MRGASPSDSLRVVEPCFCESGTDYRARDRERSRCGRAMDSVASVSRELGLRDQERPRRRDSCIPRRLAARRRAGRHFPSAGAGRCRRGSRDGGRPGSTGAVRKSLEKTGEAVPCREVEAAKRRLDTVVRVADLAERDRISIRPAAREVAKQTGLAASSIRRWHARCRGWPRRDWLALLVRQRGGAPPKAKVDERAWSAFLADYLDSVRPRVASSLRRARRTAKANGWGPLPSESTVRRMVDALPEGIKVLAREGRQAAASMHPVQRIDYGDVPSGHFVSADGLKLDTLWTDWGDGRPINTSTLWVFADVPTSFIMVLNSALFRREIVRLFRHWESENFQFICDV